jgi:phosphoribosylamine--glycine ligase
MGGYTRPSYATPELLERVEATILRPTIDGMAAEGCPYRGVLYAGLMLTVDGPRVLEFNARFGDPEAQLILPLLDGSLLEVCQAVVDGRLDRARVHWHADVTCGVVLAAAGYPEQPRLGEPIDGLEALSKDLPPDVVAFHAGTRRDGERLVTSGGRVLTLVARGATLADARRRVYAAASLVSFAGCHYRSDIGIESAVLAHA